MQVARLAYFQLVQAEEYVQLLPKFHVLKQVHLQPVFMQKQVSYQWIQVATTIHYQLTQVAGYIHLRLVQVASHTIPQLVRRQLLQVEGRATS